MPPGICIPPHHDTGYWVNYTHRLHLPIITSPDHVIFRIGPTVDSMVSGRSMAVQAMGFCKLDGLFE